MTAPKPPPRTLQPADERKVQLLERAAPIVLEDPQLTVERWRVLAALANEMDLSAEQFRSTIDDLLQRGVIKRLEVTPPKPPPLPGQRPGPSSVAAPEKETTEDFALTPPGAPPPVQVSPLVERASRSPTPMTAASHSSRPPRERFLDRAEMILTEQRGFNAKSQMLLAAAAEELGLNESEARAALESLHRAGE